MLQATVIREQTQAVLAGLQKRNFKEGEVLVKEILENDQRRRDTQKILDDLKAKSNTDSKKIGELMKSGKADEATALRAAVAADKDMVKALETELENYEKRQLEILYKIPNVPHEKVPAGVGADDNQREGPLLPPAPVNDRVEDRQQEKAPAAAVDRPGRRPDPLHVRADAERVERRSERQAENCRDEHSQDRPRG